MRLYECKDVTIVVDFDLTAIGLMIIESETKRVTLRAYHTQNTSDNSAVDFLMVYKDGALLGLKVWDLVVVAEWLWWISTGRQ